MALKVWLPLNGNLKNNGTSNSVIAVSGATVNTSGKLGSCYSFDGSDDYISITDSNLYSIFKGGAQPFSIAMWVYHADSTRAILFGDYGLSGSISFNIELYTSHGVRFYWNANPDYNTTIDVGASTWTHIAITYDGSSLCSYKNGSLVNTRSGALASLSKTSGAFYLGRDSRTGTTVLNGRLNDVRIYDHCLSVTEIKEIARGLVCHYPLDNQNEIAATSYNKYSGDYAAGSSSSASFTKTKLANERGYKYTYNYTGNGSNIWPNIYFPYFTFTAGKKHVYSLKVRCNIWTAGSLTLRGARCGNDYYGCASTEICSLAKADGQWHEYYVTQQLDATFNASGTTKDTNPHMELYCSNLNGNGTVYNFDIDIKDVQVVESDVYIPYTENSFLSSTIPDISGLGNNGTITGTLAYENNPPRNYFSAKFISGTKVSATKGFVVAGNPTFTVNFWLKMTGGTYTQWSDVVSFTGNAQIRLETSNTSGTSISWYNYPIGTSSGFGSKAITAGQWYMVTMTCDGSNFKFYYDGALTQTVAVSGTTWTPNGAFSLGDTGMLCNISDFRIYATALSATDIKNLYEASQKIDNKDVIHSFDYNEQSTISLAKNTTTVGSLSEFTALQCLKYDTKTYMEPDGSAWVRIFHHSNPASKLFASGNTFANSVYIDADRWFNFQVCNDVSTWEFMIKQKAESTTATESKYRWIQTKNPMTAVFADVASASITKVTTSGYSSFSHGGLYKIQSNTYLCTNNGTNGNWWGAVGAWTNHQSGIPAWAGVIVKTGYEDVYLRIDNLTDATPVNAQFKKSGIMTASQFIEM